MKKTNNQDSIKDENSFNLEVSKLAIEERKLVIEEQKFAYEKEQNAENIRIENEKIRLEKLKIWSSPIFTVILSVLALGTAAYVTYWSRKEVEASRIEIYTHTTNKKMSSCRACWKKCFNESAIGFQARVNFNKPFVGKPNVITVLSLITVFL